VHRQEGVYSTGQLEVINEMAALNLRSGDIRQANKLQKFSFAISRDKYGADDLDILPAHSRLIQWYMETGQYSEVRRELDKAMELVKEHTSEHDPRLIDYMRLVAKTRRLQGIWKSEKSLIEALEILDKNPDLPLDVKSGVYLELADAYVARRKPKKAEQYYSQVTLGEGQQTEPALIPITSSISMRAKQGGRYSAAFKVPLSEKDYGVMVTESNFTQPSLPRSTPMIGNPFQFSRDLLIGGLRLRPNLNFRRVKMTFEFTVTKSGKVQEVEVLASNAPSKLDNFMRKVLAKIRYRPGLLENIPIDTPKVQLTQTF
jgi:tetratricopeptide (TPR) repeat protein